MQKAYHKELSKEHQDNLSLQEKFDNLKLLYTFAKSKEAELSLLHNFLHELLMIQIATNKHDIQMFEEYLKYPIESWMYSRKAYDKDEI